MKNEVKEALSISNDLVNRYPWLPSLKEVYANIGEKPPAEFISEIFASTASKQIAERILEIFEAAFNKAKPYSAIVKACE